VNSLTDRSNLDHLRKQAKDLLRDYRAADSSAFERLRTSLPAARGKTAAALTAMQLKLHDAQSAIAREHGFASWNDLKDAVELRRARSQDLRALRLHWAGLVFGGDLTGGSSRPRPELAARVLAENSDLVGDDPWFAAATGDEKVVRQAIAADPAWPNRVGGLLDIPPLIAAAHSSLVRPPAFRAGVLACLQLLLDRGADPNAAYFNRRPPHSLEKPGDERLTAIYGAAGKIHDVDATRLLLAAGADANDNESLYHSIDDPDRSLPCMQLLLAAGTRVAGSNALAKILDFDHLPGLRLLLSHVEHGDPDLGRILHWAIYRGRSAAHVRALLDAGADPKSLDQHRQDAYHHAANYGLPEVMRLLQGDAGELTDTERFVSACARADAAAARAVLGRAPDILSRLAPAQLKQLPNLAMSHRDDAVRLMVELGWPIATRGGDIDGSALNWAVFRGRPELAEFLMEHGATFREPHGYGSDVLGTLSWASLNEPRNDGDWVGCAAVLRDHGVPRAQPLPESAWTKPHVTVLVDGRRLTVPAEVADVLLGET